MNKLEEIIAHIQSFPSDINEHFPTLKKYGIQCDRITEMGVRWITSTWAFLGCLPETMVSIDMRNPSTWNVGGAGENQGIIQRGYNTIEEVYQIAEEFNINYKFIEANVLEIDIEETDLLFIDTWHAYKQLKAELNKFHLKVTKYIVLHDTTNYAFRDETNYEELGPEWKGDGKGIWPAVLEFIEQNPNWIIKEKFENNNGLTILERIK